MPYRYVDFPLIYVFIYLFHLYYDYIFVGYIKMRMIVQTMIIFMNWCNITVQVAV
jgi:hypothetical protein